MNENFVDALDIWLQSRLQGIHTAIPARVESYSAQDRKASVLPLVSLRIEGGGVLEMPKIDGVPVVFPGGGKFRFEFPIEPGDNVLLIFAETGIGAYLAGDGRGPTAADDVSRFSLTDAIAIPGLFPFGGVSRSSTAFYTDGEVFALRNEITSLKAQLAALWDAVKGLNDAGASWTSIPAVPGSPVTPDPSTIAGYVAASAAADAAKAGLDQLWSE